MDQKEIIEKLQAKNKNLRLPSGMDFNIQNKVLTIGMKEKGLTANMQTDDSAFEGWAICLKAWLPELIDQVNIEGKTPPNISDKHYQRFLYRLDKFIKIYTWASTKSYEIELDEFRRKNVNVVINVPKSKASESATHCEAQLERAFCKKNENNYNFIDHQLPVRLFNDEIKEDKSITPKSYLDIWSIKDNLLRIFELKLPTNAEIGIISELMFYVNVMTDVIKGDVKIPFSSEYRSFNHLFKFQRNNKCKKIEGVLLADNLHSGIKNKLNEVLQIINEGNFSFNIKYLYEKPKLIDTTIINDDSKENNDMKKEITYKSLQKKKQLELLHHNDFFENAIGCGIQWNKDKKVWEQYPHILRHQDSLKNLYAPIRQKVLAYFDEYNIAWWRADEDRYFPTGNLLSSQIHCLNHLFALRTDNIAVKAIIEKATGLQIERVLPSPLDKDGGYITFEFVCKNKTLLGEKHETRGKNCTSVDAFVLVETEKEKKVLIPIEWKYTESYEKKDKNKANLAIVEERYTALAKNDNSNLGDWPDKFNWDPLYEFARQTLLMEQIKAKPETSGIDKVYDYIHIIVRPDENKEIIDDIKQFKDLVKVEGKKRIIEIDPQELLSPLKGNDDYKELLNYLETRYWK